MDISRQADQTTKYIDPKATLLANIISPISTTSALAKPISSAIGIGICTSYSRFTTNSAVAVTPEYHPQNISVSNLASTSLGAPIPPPIENISRQAVRTPQSIVIVKEEAISIALVKPTSSAAGTGTYSCTYHGCLGRFEISQKLQRHKRDKHRNNPSVTPGISSSITAKQLMERNSQSGPHKCDRINPTTGKPYNSDFSRPYDLTRHEDTIHNMRKQKYRYAICTEEKTFSYMDALTHHMHVVHPKVDFPGKRRKRDSRGD
jgi:hypothetical protein